MKLSLLSILCCGMAFAGDWVVPWVTHNSQFNSTLFLTNPSAQTVVVHLAAKRNGGEQFEAQLSLDPLAQHVAPIDSLFPELGEGAGFALYLSSESNRLLGSYMVIGTQSASGSSPAQGNLQRQDAAGQNLVFPFLPDPSAQISAPVVVNLGETEANLVMTAYQDSTVLGQRAQTLAPGEPYAAVAHDLFPDFSGPIYLHVSADQPLAGTSFAFNELLEPSISEALVVAEAPATPVDPTPAGVTTLTLDTAITRDGVTMGPDGFLYAAEGWSGQRVFRISREGAVETYATGLRGPIDMAFDREGNMMVAEIAGSLVRVAPDGTATRFATLTQTPNGVAVGPDGNTYVTHFGRGGSGRKIERVTPDGTVTTFAEGGSIQAPIGLAFDDAGTLYNTNFRNGAILKIDANGQQETLVTIPNTLLGYVRVVGDDLIVSAHTNNVLYRVNKESGDWTVIAGSGAAGETDGPLLEARFTSTWGLAVSADGKDVFVTSYRDSAGDPIVRRVHLD
ncbi:Vgb family protein [Acanthopleuribacter pedis]|uniref:NHL repeat-containing protein n=1 Tax=Acanthopleuribacter pedis TaxID=442870 RepID=A0A8J7Q2Q5_9BACT|nr:NHL repeat-containing protein [Acanthopleuribacter pedis]MBO1319477.1 NHL repeat-containing protein [Acanthopleuribacter pedis]